MTNPEIDAACDVVEAALTGSQEYTRAVTAVHGLRATTRGMGALLVFLVNDAARESGAEPAAIVQRIRETYGG
jgi:hypothetical protein